ncbi:MAG TPA: electron transfer flavoprotein subunit beta/FixA family protein [Thermoplasmata archaeon]|nr:electron transfer flavoprotein subunit beta/FixA family protein [Thermoplasmata archaeon]
MDCVVLVKGVPDFREGKVSFKEDNTLNRGATPTVLNPNDHHALHAALQVKVIHGGTVNVVSMGPPNYKTILKEAFEHYGDRAYLLSDRMMGGADTLATAWTLAGGIKKIGMPDLIIAGFKSADGETGQTGPQTAFVLDMPIITHVTEFQIDEKRRMITAKRLDGLEVETVEAPLPVFIVTDPGFTANYRSARHRLKLQQLQDETRARAQRIETVYSQWSLADLPVEAGKCGLKGSPTIVNKVEPIPTAPKERTARIFHGANPGELSQAAKLIADLVVK